MVGTRSLSSGAHSRDPLALPTLIWGLVSQGFRTGLGWIFAVKGRRAEPCVAQRADRAPSVDWLPRIAAAHCITSYPVGPLIRTHIPHACGEEAMRMRPIYAPAWFGPWVARSSSILRGARLTPWRARASSVLCFHGCALRNEPGGEITPQRHNQLARQRDDGDALGAPASIGRTGAEPVAEGAVRLMAEPKPGQFDCLVASTPIACLADALLAVDAATLPGTGRQSAIAGDLAPVAEVLVEQLIHQCCGEGWAERLEPLQQVSPLGHRRGNSRGLRGLHLLQRRKLFTHQHQPRVLALRFGQKMRREGTPLPIALPLQPSQPVPSPRVADRHAQKTQQRLDPVGMGRLFRNQTIAFAAGAPGILLFHAWHPNNPNHPRLAPQMGHQGAQQKLTVDPVRLRPPRPLLHRYARSIEYQATDPGRFQQPVQPKAVVAGFIATHHSWC